MIAWKWVWIVAGILCLCDIMITILRRFLALRKINANLESQVIALEKVLDPSNGKAVLMHSFAKHTVKRFQKECLKDACGLEKLEALIALRVMLISTLLTKGFEQK